MTDSPRLADYAHLLRTLPEGAEISPARIASDLEKILAADTAPKTAPNSGRISVRINDDTARAMTNLVVRDRTATEVVRRAVAVLDLVERKEAEGKHMEFVTADGKTREKVHLLW